MRAATARVGLVSPRSTWESIGADTPVRSARSRSDSDEASRSARTRGPKVTSARDGVGSAATATVRAYVITYSASRGGFRIGSPAGRRRRRRAVQATGRLRRTIVADGARRVRLGTPVVVQVRLT